MHDIEAINFEQLATVTDRLLLRGSSPKRRPSYHRISVQRIDLVPELVLRPNPSHDLWRRFTTTALITALVSVSAAIVTLL